MRLLPGIDARRHDGDPDAARGAERNARADGVAQCR
jgi:hypothetical protein